jgi:acetyl esterase
MTMDADAQKVLDMMKAAGRPTLDKLTPPEGRAAYRQARKAMSPDPIDVADWRDLEAPSARGPIPLRFYRGRGAPQTNTPCLIFIHGGGYVIGDLDTHDHVCRKLANESAGAVISIDYRLAPEHGFPIPVEDCAAAARWIHSQASALGIDAGRLAIGGDSAGGNLSAVMCLMSRNGDGPRYVFQALLYPGTNLNIDYAPDKGVGANPDLPLTNTLTNWFHNQYVPNRADRADWRASAFHAKDHSGLPPAFVLTAHYDPIGEDGAAYAKKLQAAGVRVWHLDMSDQIHGFLTMGRVVRAADTALEMCGAALRYAYATAAG